MGIEAFGVSMRFIQADAGPQLRRILADYSHIRIGDKETAAGYGVTGEYDDGAHFIDLQLSETEGGNRTLAVRFSLCSYESIDQIFIDLISNILSSLDADVWLMTSALKQKGHYLPGDSKWLIAALPDEIIEMRAYWQKLFGTKQGAVRVKDSFAFVGACKARD